MGSESHWTLRIHLVVEITMPRQASLFYALVLAFWRFQSLSAASLFTAVLQAVQERARAQLLATHPGRFRDKGGCVRRWRLPFGEACLRLCKLLDKETGRVVWPLKLVMDLPQRVRWCEATLLPGYRLAVIQSFRQSRKVLQGTVPDGAAPSASTLHRRFQGFASQLDPLPDPGEEDSAASWPYRLADGTKLKLQHKGFDAGVADMRLVVGSRTPSGPLEVLDFSIGESWEDIGQRVDKRFSQAKVLVSDGEEHIPRALAGPDTRHQRCLVHARRGLPFALYRDGCKKAQRRAIEEAFRRIPGLQLSQAEMARLDPSDRAALQDLLAASERALAEIQELLPENAFPHTRRYVLGLIEDGLAYLRHLLETGEKVLLSTNRLESILSRIALRLKRIGRRWSVGGAMNMLAACLVYALHPQRYAEVEAAVRGEHCPGVSILITSLKTAWST
ncbi:MAG: ISH6 family transposase [Desulfotomaculales bacterium]